MIYKKISSLFLALFIVGCSDTSDNNIQSTVDPSVERNLEVNAELDKTNMVHWLVPAPGPLDVRSEEEKQHGMQNGRSEPQPELLQPPLDHSIKSFEPSLDRNTVASYVGGASDILPGLVSLWINEFNKIYPNVDFQIKTPYAGSLGMLKVIDGEYDFVFVSRELKPTDRSSFEEKYGYQPTSIPISGAAYRHYGFLDAIGFFVNVNNPLSGLSFEQIDAIFSKTRHRSGEKIETWGQLGLKGKWENLPIHAYGIKPWNGFEEFVRQRVLNYEGKRGEWNEDIHFERQAFPIAKLIADDPLGIGYTGLAYITEGVKVLPLADEKKSHIPVAPTYENVALATYPLSRLIYFNFNSDPDSEIDPVLREFVRFVLSKEGQQLVLDHAIYLPLRNWQVEESRKLID